MKTVKIKARRPLKKANKISLKKLHEKYATAETNLQDDLLTPKSRENLRFLLIEAVEITKAHAGGIYIKVADNERILNHGDIYPQLDLTSLEEKELSEGKSLIFDNLMVTSISNIGKVQVNLALKINRCDVCHQLKRELNKITKFMATEFDLPTRSLILDHYTEELDSKKKELEKAQNYNKHLLSLTTHDLSSPLNAIFGYLDLMNECLDSNPDMDRLKSYKDMIRHGANDISDMLNQLREVVQLENGQETLNNIKLDLNWIAGDVCSLLNTVANKKGHTLKVQLLEEPLFVKADLTKLKRILHNLVMNAIKYTPEGGEIKVKVFNSIRGVGISVKDNGIGIPKDKHQEIFEAFSRVHKKFPGTKKSYGLGLYISSVFTRMMDAELQLESEVGEGSEFTIYFNEVKGERIQTRQAS